MLIAVRVNTDDVVQLICNHPIDLQPNVGGHPVAGLGTRPLAARL
jgi:hypothetical protein